MAKFRFRDLEIWQMAIEIANELFDIADHIEQKLDEIITLCAMRYALCARSS